MGWFRKKKREEKEAPYPAQSRRVMVPTASGRPVITTREYRIFKKMEKRKPTWYERLAGFSEKILKVKATKDMREELEKAIRFADLRITPDSVMSLMVSTMLLFVVLGVSLGVSGAIPMMGGILIVALGLPLGYYFYKYPTSLLKTLRIKASSQVVLAVLYLVVSMRISPNLERALRFAAMNITGPLAWDMRRLLWDIEMGKYYSAEEALNDHIVKWKPENEEFAEALRLIKDSQSQVPERGRKELDEALNVVLEGTKTRMKHYAQELTMPVMVIHMMGIVLPVLGTIMAPLVAVFLSDSISPLHFILGYNVILPIVIIWFIKNTLNKRPVTFSPAKISKHPDLPGKGTIMLGGREVPVLPISLLVLLIFFVPAIYYFIQNPNLLMGGIAGREFLVYSFAMSSFIILGIGFSMASYFILSNCQRLRIQKEIENIEGEFELALFQLGNRIAGGTPTEVAIEKSIDDVKDLSICGLFRHCLRNIRSLGMTFEASLFHPRYGALKYYPSELIRNIMYTITETAKRGVGYASEGMLRIARYLKNIRETQEYIRELLSETVSSMKFQAYFLTPMITGLIVSMADIIIQVLSKLGGYMQSVGFNQELGFGDVSSIFGNMENVISPEIFQIIVGIYLIEVIAILGMFMTKIEKGDSRISLWNNIGKMLVVGLILYFLVALMGKTVFGGLIESALSNLGWV